MGDHTRTVLSGLQRAVVRRHWAAHTEGMFFLLSLFAAACYAAGKMLAVLAYGTIWMIWAIVVLAWYLCALTIRLIEFPFHIQEPPRPRRPLRRPHLMSLHPAFLRRVRYVKVVH